MMCYFSVLFKGEALAKHCYLGAEISNKWISRQ